MEIWKEIKKDKEKGARRLSRAFFIRFAVKV
jgi:hypothetical protein